MPFSRVARESPPNTQDPVAYFYPKNVAVFRHLLCDPGFAQCIDNVPAYDPEDPSFDFGNPEANPASGTMGDYLPRVSICCKSTFESGGAAACFTAPFNPAPVCT